MGITPRILKRYEQTGVLRPERLQDNDYRAYTAEDIIKLQVAEQLKAVGFTSRQISGYFTGDLDIKDTCKKLSDHRERIERLLDTLSYDLKPETPRFSVVPENTQLCYVESFPLREELLQRYYDSRETYCSAISSGCICDNFSVFFLMFDEGNNETYRICLPVTAAPEKLYGDGKVQSITRKTSLVMKLTGAAPDIGGLLPLLFAEAERRGIKLSENLWTMSETDPNRKTAVRLYTYVIGAQIAQ